MLIRDLKKENVKVGIRTYYKWDNIWGTITNVERNRDCNPIIIITWDNGNVNPALSYERYISEVVDDYFFISNGKTK